VLNTGEFALIDMDKKTILGNGQPTASRSAYTTSRQFCGFDPGPNTFGFVSPVYNAGALLTIIATPAWE
jgi:phage-related protein